MTTRRPRSDALGALVRLMGEHRIKITDRRDGWPAHGDIFLESGTFVRAAIFVRNVILSGRRDRDDVERRIENPGKGRPMMHEPERVPLLLGVWEHDPLISVEAPVLMAVDARKREARATRHSVFVPLELLIQAANSGWAEGANAAGEMIFCFHPVLLPAFVAMQLHGPKVDGASLLAIAEAAGIGGGAAREVPEERARRASMSLVRDRLFSRRVLEAYDDRCAMCGLNLGLVEGAHIYPAAAAGSPDDVWNGVALCGNHHAAFDAFQIVVHPATRQIQLHPELPIRARRSAACESFLVSTLGQLTEPQDGRLRPRDDMFVARYEHFGDRYDWAREHSLI